MPGLEQVEEWLHARLPDLVTEHHVPGASVAVLAGDRVIDAAAGLLSKATGVEATTDSVFQIGSIGKVWTTTLAMQLVDEGKLDLDASVRGYLPEFRVRDEVATAKVTIRQLMCHTAGFEGDVLTDTGRGDDCLEKYLEVIRDVPQLFAPGKMFSYNNVGFIVLGRVVEALRGAPFETCVRDYLISPLELTHTAYGPEEAIRYRAAVGHLQETPDGDPRPTEVWCLPRSNAPAGSMLSMRARDLLGFARMHLSEGVGSSPEQVLSPASVRAMQERQTEVPDLGNFASAWGLGWVIYDFAGGPVIGHDGSTIGQNARLRVVPGRQVAVAIMTNGGDSLALSTEIMARVLGELADVETPAPPVPGAGQPISDAGRYVGTYASSAIDTTVSQRDDGTLWIQWTPKGAFAEVGAVAMESQLVHWRGDAFLPVRPPFGVMMPHVFVGDDGSGRAAYLHTGRADRRVEERV